MASAAVKYVLHPGRVVSKTDGDLHYVGARELARLYGVRFDECVIASEHNTPEGLIALCPQYSGDYTLPTR